MLFFSHKSDLVFKCDLKEWLSFCFSNPFFEIRDSRLRFVSDMQKISKTLFSACHKVLKRSVESIIYDTLTDLLIPRMCVICIRDVQFSKKVAGSEAVR